MNHPTRLIAAPRSFAAVSGSFRPIGALLSQLVVLATRARVSPARVGSGPGIHPDRQAAVAFQRSALTGRHRAPTWGPTQWGGEGTTSREVVACKAVSARRA
jgi:hypothetical protein